MKKIYENEKRLQAGEHSLDLLAHDFEKNYNMYIFPVHWQFGQLDQHPADGYVPEGAKENYQTKRRKEDAVAAGLSGKVTQTAKL